MDLLTAQARTTQLLLTGGRHPDYARTVAHATLCRQLSTGNIADLLRRFNLRETETEFKVRQLLTVSTVPAVWHELRTPYYQVAQLSGADVERRFDFPATSSDEERVRLTSLLTDAVDHYYADQPVEDFFADRIREECGHD